MMMVLIPFQFIVLDFNLLCDCNLSPVDGESKPGVPGDNVHTSDDGKEKAGVFVMPLLTLLFSWHVPVLSVCEAFL